MKKGPEKNTRKKAAGYLVVFLSFMFLFTMISRGIYAYQMPRVAIGQASTKSIFHTIRVQGEIEAAREAAVVLMEGVRIREICVKTGEKVEPGRQLLRLDRSDLENIAEGLYEKIRVSEARIAAWKGSVREKSSLMEEEYALAHVQARYNACQQLLKKKGRIESTWNGYITQICVKVGDRTPDSAVILYADVSSNPDKEKNTDDAAAAHRWDFTAELTQEQADVIKAGDIVSLQFQNGRIKEEDRPITTVRKTGGETYEAVAAVTADGLSPGDSGTLEMSSQSGTYACCVPLSAIYSDGNKDYVLLIRDTDTILGTELSVVRKDVIVVDKNESMAALKDDSLGAEDRIVVSSNKTVEPGDKVRLFEEGDQG